MNLARSGETGVLIVDDEEPARSIVREVLSAQPGVRILGECSNGFEAVKAASELQPDVVFLDIEMPKLDGFEVRELIDPRIAVVFVTAYDSYALRAFEVHAVDYVLKPFHPDRLTAALERARARVGERGEATLRLSPWRPAPPGPDSPASSCATARECT
ncbi:MAG: response regulator [Acidobacteriota bacterium]